MHGLSAQRITLLGEAVDLVTCGELMDFLARKVAAAEKAIVSNHNTHSFYLLARHPEMRAAYERADLVELDSTPLIFWGRLLGKPVHRAHRCTYLDWREAFWRQAAENGWRVFYLGGAPGVAETAAERLCGQWPGVRIATHHGFFAMTPGSEAAQAVVDRINAFRPDILFVGMGMPRQEIWISRFYDALHSGVVLAVGAAAYYEAGVQAAAPRWTGRVGLEWLFRLFSDPKRMAGRYLLEPWGLLPAMAGDVRAALVRGRGNAVPPTSDKARQSSP